MEYLRQLYEKQKQWFWFSMGATFFWGMLAHAYCFFDNSFSHDSLKELHGANYGTDFKVELGRIFVPFYRDIIRSDATMPWLIGMLSLMMLGLTVFFVAKTFRMKSKVLVFLTAGILCVNQSVTAVAATYIHDLDCYMLSLLCAAAAVYLWDRHDKGFLPGAVLVTISMGMYQSYISVVIALAMFVCILQLLDGDSFQTVLFKGLKAIAMILIGGALYYVSMIGVQKLLSIEMATGGYNTVDRALQLTPALIVEMVAGAYGDSMQRFWNAYSAYPGLLVKGATAVLLLVSAATVAGAFLDKKMGVLEKVLCALLIGLLPLGMNILYVLVLGDNHDLMVYAIWLMYLLALLLADRFARRYGKKILCKSGISGGNWVKILCMFLVGVLIYGNVQFANGLYLKKDLEYDAYLSLMTRVTYRLEEQENYVPGETPVFFAGIADNLNDEILGFREYQQIVGATTTDVIYAAERMRYRSYFRYVMGMPIRLVGEAQWRELRQDPRVQAMPAYPAADCIAMIDDVLVVKMGNSYS